MSLYKDATFVLVPSSVKERNVFALKPDENGDLNFARASTATRINSSGFIVDSPRNLLQRSEEFENTYWTKIGTTTVEPNVGMSPIGTITADRINNILDVGDDRLISSSITIIPNQTYTASIYVKGEGLNIGKTVTFVVKANTGTSSETIKTVTITSEWQRISIAHTFLFDNTSASFLIRNFNSNATSCLIWGSQFELGSLTNYVFTTDRLNTPRLDYSFGGCPVLLLEPQKTNLLLRSNEFTNSLWVRAAQNVVSENTLSIDGTSATQKLVANPANGSSHEFYQVSSVVTLSVYTFSIYVKKADYNYIFLGLKGEGNSSGAYFNMNTNTFESVGGNLMSTSALVLQNGWVRISITFTASSSTVLPMVALALNTSTTLHTSPGNNLGTLIYGAQLETGVAPTSYIPTNTATVTRVTETFTRPNIFSNNIISSAGGTWFVELENNIPLIREFAGNGLFISSSSIGGLSGNGLRITTQSLTSSLRIRVQRHTGSTVTTMHTTTSNKPKLVIKWDGTTVDVFEDGIKVVSGSTFLTNVSMNNFSGLNADVAKNIKQMALWNKPLTDAQCILLSSL